MRRCPLFLPAIGAVMGIVTGDSGTWIGLVPFMVLLAIAALMVRKRNLPGWEIYLLTTVCLFVFASQQAQEVRHIDEFPLKESLSRKDSVEVAGSGWIRSVNPSSSRSLRAVLQLEELTVAGHPIATDHCVPVWIQSPPKGMTYGSLLEFTGLLKPLDRARSPGGFDPAEFYYRHYSSPAQLEIRSGDACRKVEVFRGSRLVAGSKRLRSHLESTLIDGLSPEDEPYARLIAAMTLGARENSPEELEDWYRRSGTMHLFAVSGLHVGIIGGTLLFVALLVRLPKRWAVLIIIPLVLFYAVLTGLRPSAVRAAIMLSIVLASFAVKEQPRLLNSLSLAALLLLAFNPQQLFLPGFQLSFAVLFTIITLGDLTRQWLAGPWLSDPFIPKKLLSPARRFKDRFVGTTAAALAVSMVAWTGSALPLSWHFQSVAPVGILANLIMVPTAWILVNLAVASFACFGLHLTWLGNALHGMNLGVASVLTAMAQFFATLPGAHLHTGKAETPAESEIITFDVMGQRGDFASLLTIHDSSSHWMIDCGSNTTYRYELLPLLRHRGINHLDGLFLSHGDQGHMGAAPLVLTQLHPPLLFESRAKNRAAAYPDTVALADSLGIQRHSLSKGNRLTLSDNVKCEVLAPFLNSEERFADDRALVLKLTSGDWSILISSDAGFETEKRLLESDALLDSDIWIRGQHRSSPSGLPAFVKAVSPRAVISSRSDFPVSEQISSDLIEQLESMRIPILPLDSTGVITLRILPDSVEIAPFAAPEAAISLRLE